VVIIRDASFIDVEGLVRYVYRGEVEVLPERLPSFLKTAELLKIKGLADQGIPKKFDKDEENGNNYKNNTNINEVVKKLTKF